MLTTVRVASNLVIRIVPRRATEGRSGDYVLFADGELGLSVVNTKVVKLSKTSAHARISTQRWDRVGVLVAIGKRGLDYGIAEEGGGVSSIEISRVCQTDIGAAKDVDVSIGPVSTHEVTGMRATYLSWTYAVPM